MSTRERWIVYPLLFLTLGIVMRDKMREMVNPVVRANHSEFSAGRVRCGQLEVDQVASVGGLAVRKLQCEESVVGRMQCREMVVLGANGRPAVLIGTDLKTKGGVVMTLSASGTPLILLQPTDAGGVVMASQIVQGKLVPSEKSKPQTSPVPKKSSNDPGKKQAEPKE